MGNDAFVTAGAVVLSDVAKGVTVAGNPASPLG
jgi:acetyltransferase-like isoleucine patch superfamily enzyme